jgi:ATP synthase protein I
MKSSMKKSMKKPMKSSVKRVNTRGWWGILTACLIGSVAALAVAVAVAWLAVGGAAAASLGLAGAAVVVLSGLTLLVTAWSWDRWREQAVFIALFGFVVKIILMAVLLTVVPTPAWLDTMAAGVGALVAIVAWQVTEVLVFARTRQQIYDD